MLDLRDQNRKLSALQEAAEAPARAMGWAALSMHPHDTLQMGWCKRQRCFGAHRGQRSRGMMKMVLQEARRDGKRLQRERNEAVEKAHPPCCRGIVHANRPQRRSEFSDEPCDHEAMTPLRSSCRQSKSRKSLSCSQTRFPVPPSFPPLGLSLRPLCIELHPRRR